MCLFPKLCGLLDQDSLGSTVHRLKVNRGCQSFGLKLSQSTLMVNYLLCILTSEGVLCTLFAGQNRLSDAKTTLVSLTEQNKQKIKGKQHKIMQNMQTTLLLTTGQTG